MSALVVLNPAARGGRARRARPALDAALARSGIEATVVETAGPGDAERIARDADAALVVAAGGDGTVHEVVNGLADHGPGGPALGVIPLGTGNDFARALGVPMRLADAALALTASAPVAIDLGEVEWEDDEGTHVRRFANAVGAGFDAEAAALAGETKWAGGRRAYLAAVLRTLWGRRDMAARVAADGAVLADGPLLLCEVGNGQAVGGGFRLTPGAALDDGLLDVCHVRDLSTVRALRLLPRSFTGAHTAAPEVTMAQATQVEIEAAGEGLALHADGEILSRAARRVRVGVLPGALRVVAPALAAPPRPRSAVAERRYNS